MKQLYKYILKSFIGPFLLTLLIAIFILLMIFLWHNLDDMVGKGLGFYLLAEIIAYAAVGVMPMALPLAVLLAAVMSFGNLSERLEFLAIKTSGISLWKLMRPAILLTVGISIFAFYLSNSIVPVVNSKFAALLRSVKNQRPEVILKEGRFSNELDHYSIKVNHIDRKTNTLHNIMIYDHTSNLGNDNVTVADSGYLKMSTDKQYMVLHLYHGESNQDIKQSKKNSHPYRRQNFDYQKIVINVDNFALEREDNKQFRKYIKMLTNRQLHATANRLIQDHFSNMKKTATTLHYNSRLDEQLKSEENPLLPINKIETNDSISLNVSSFERLSIADKRIVLSIALQAAQKNQRILLQHETLFNNTTKLINKHWIEYHQRYIYALACLLFFLIGAPLGAIIQKGGFGTPVLLSIGLFIAFYLMNLITQKAGRSTDFHLSPLLWTPFLLFSIMAFLLVIRSNSDAFLRKKWKIRTGIKKTFQGKK